MAREGVRARPRKDGTIAYLAMWRDATGKIQSKTFDTERAAVTHRNKMLSEIADGVVHGDKKLTFAQLCARFLETFNPKKEATWIVREQVIRNHLIPAFGPIKVAKLTGLEIDRWLAKCRTEPMCKSGRKADSPVDLVASPRTVQMWIATLRMVLRQAVKWRLIPRSPLDDATPPSAPAYGVVAHWREEEAATFFAHDPEHVDYPLWVVLATCQLRISEALALRWSDIDDKRGVLRVERGLSRKKSGGFAEDSPKTASSRRAVSAPPEALAALAEQKRRQDERRKLLGRLWKGDTVPGWVFDNGEGIRLSANTARQRLDRAIEAAGVPRITAHALRHSGATSLARGGMPMYLLSRRLGHASETITSRIYVHPGDTDAAAHVDGFAGRILGKKSG